MTDHMIRATASGVRAFAAITTDLAEEARRRHDCYPIAAAALGRTMTAALLLAANLKNDEAITVRIDGDGPLGKVVADANPLGLVRGYVAYPHAVLPLRNGKLPVGEAVGQGLIHVTRFMDERPGEGNGGESGRTLGLKHPFTGSVPLVTGEIGDDVANYLLVSEQTPSTIALGVLVNPDYSVAAAGGLLVQAMPGAEEAVLAVIEANLATMPPLSQLIKSGHDASAILDEVFNGLSVTKQEPSELKFYCQCSRQRVENMLVSLGQAELADMVAEGKAEVRCHFCGETYQFTADRLAELAKQAENQAK